MAEYLVAEIPARYLPGVLDSGQDPPFIWVGHYPPERRPYESQRLSAAEYVLVTFADYRPRQHLEMGRWRVKIGQPTWRHIPRAEVEQLIGESLD